MRVYRKAAWAVCLAMALAGGGCAERVAQPGPSDGVVDAYSADPSEGQIQLAEQTETIAELRAAVARLEEREHALTDSLKQAIRERTGQAPPQRVETGGAGEAQAALAAELTAMKQELAAERQRRSDVEAELARLKSETSGSAFSRGAPSDEVPHLRDELDRERAKHQQLLAELRALQEDSPLAKHPRGLDAGGASADVRALRARLLDLETRHQEVMSSVARTVAADRKREQELLAQLAAARDTARPPAPQVVAAPAPPDADLRQAKEENERLRAMLEDERERNARLAAKLKLAGRVTDLIFKMKQQAGEPPPAPAPPEAPGTP